MKWCVVPVLVLGLNLGSIIAMPVEATVSNISVTPDTRLAEADAKYTIVLTTGEDLTKGTDTISIVFSTGMIPSAAANAPSDVTIEGDSLDSTSDYLVSGQRLTLTVPGSGTLSAGAVTVVIGVSGTKITNPVAGSYTVDVYTSKETTAVTSAAFIINGSADSKLTVASVVLDDYAVGVAAQYTITVTTETATLAANTDTIVITFPDGTTVPTSISNASYVTIGGTALDATTDYSADGQVVTTLTVPADVLAGSVAVVFLADAGVTNPTTAGTYSLTAYTTQESIESDATNYASAIVAGTGSLIALTAPTVFYLTPNVATTFTVVATDAYGNLTGTGTLTILFLTNSDTGSFDTGSFGIISGTMTNGVINATYTDTTAGTYTITIRAVPQSTFTNTITQVITVNLQVGLYHGTDLVASYDTIQAAIDAALPYDTIKLGAGTYPLSSTLTIDKPITLQSVNGASYTKLTNTANIDVLVDVTYVTSTGSAINHVTIEGITFERLRPGVEIGYAIYARSSDYFTVQNCVFNYINRVPIYVSSEVINIRSTTIRNNTINNGGIYGSYAIALRKTYLIANVVISGNTINNFNGGGIQIGIPGGQLTNTYDVNYVTITNNTITNSSGTGILLWRYTRYVTITDNIITGGQLDGITISPNVKNAIIKNNTITDNVDDGIEVVYTAEAGNVINYNDIYNNHGYGVNAIGFGANYVNASYNYWGSATGPYYSVAAGAINTKSNMNGTGDQVTDNVSYDEWLYKSKTDVVADNTAYYAHAVNLSVGWNTLSTPIWLDSSADTWGEIVALANLQYVSAYGWDGIAWTTVDGSTQVTPLNSIFVQLKQEASVPLLYSTQWAMPPTKATHAAGGSYTGWELIGLARLENMEVDVALASIANNYSNVIDPISGEVLGATDKMEVGKGYWIYMQNDSTLAGFTITPLGPPDLSAVQPSSAAAQPPHPGIMHVQTIELWFEEFPGNRQRVYTRVSIVDADGNAVSGATVSLQTTLPDESTASDSDDTAADGTVTFYVTTKLTGEFTSTVTNVVGGNWIYNSGANEETSETLVVP